jgi:uncharacterized protein DUF4124
MKRIVAILVAAAFVPLAGAQLYKYTDKDGKTVYTDQPPANAETKTVRVQPSPPPVEASKNGTSGNKSAVERDKELEKGRKQAREQQKKHDENAQKAQLAEQRCTQARTAFQQYSEGGRIMRYNDKGEREYLGDEQIASEREKARRDVEEACKKS